MNNEQISHESYYRDEKEFQMYWAIVKIMKGNVQDVISGPPYQQLIYLKASWAGVQKQGRMENAIKSWWCTQMTATAPSCITFFYFHTLTDGCLWLCKVGRKDTAILTLQMGMWGQRSSPATCLRSHSLEGGMRTVLLDCPTPCHDSMWSPCWEDCQVPALGLNWVWVQTTLYKCDMRTVCETDAQNQPDRWKLFS